MFDKLEKSQSRQTPEPSRWQSHSGRHENTVQQRSSVPSLADPVAGEFPSFKVSFTDVPDTPPPPSARAVQRLTSRKPNAIGYDRSPPKRQMTSFSYSHLPVQLDGDGDVSSDDIHRAADYGTRTGSRTLPYLKSIQKSFGRHDISGIRYHDNPQAAQSARDMNAEAYSTAGHVVSSGSISKHTAAHEAAHYIQQQAGVRLKSHVGAVGDQHEQIADAAGDAVMQARSAEALLNRYTGPSSPMALKQPSIPAGGFAETGGHGDQGIVQRKPLPALRGKAYKKTSTFATIASAVDDYNTRFGHEESPSKKISIKYQLDALDEVSQAITEWLGDRKDWGGKKLKKGRQQKYDSVTDVKREVDRRESELKELLESIEKSEELARKQEQIRLEQERIRREQERVKQEREAKFTRAPVKANPYLADRHETRHKSAPSLSFLKPGWYKPTDSELQVQVSTETPATIVDSQLLTDPTSGMTKMYYVVGTDVGMFWVSSEQLTSRRPKKYQLTREQLFPGGRDPEPNDIKQTNLGDCYLQAALMSITTTRPQYIKEIMRDQGSTVAVRLYKVTENELKEKSFSPKYIRVQKSVPVDPSGRELYNQGKLWVRMFQKAYVAGGFAGSMRSEADLKDSSYENIVGGREGHVFEVLLGKSSQFIELLEAEDNSPLLALAKIMEVFERNGITHSKNQQIVDRVQEFCLKRAQIESSMEGGKVSVQIRLDEIVSLIKRQSKSDKSLHAASGKIIEELKKYFSGSLVEGHYTEKQLSVFNQIEIALTALKPVTAGTNKYVSGDLDKPLGYAGEQKSGGLAGSHAYAILQTCLTDDLATPKLGSTVGKYRMIQMRNPWGSYGRKYSGAFPHDRFVYSGGEDDGNDTGLFWIDLSELTKYFDGISVGDKIGSL